MHIGTTKQVFKSCSCDSCRHHPTSRAFVKRLAHRKLRHETRKALRNRDHESIPAIVSTGYIA